MSTEPDDGGSYASAKTQFLILNGHTMPAMRERASTLAADVDTVIAGLSDYGPPAAALTAWIRAIKERHQLKWAAIGMVVSRQTGKVYRNPQQTAQAWGDGISEIPGSVIVALARAYPDVDFLEFALAKRDEDSEMILRRGDLQAEMRRKVEELDRRIHDLETLGRAFATEMADALAARGVEIPDVRSLVERLADRPPPNGDDSEFAEPGV